MKFFFKIFITYLIATAVFFGGMVGVYSLDSPEILKNFQESLVVLNGEGQYPAIGDFGGWVLDNKTDAIMLSEAANVYSRGALQDAMSNRYDLEISDDFSSANLQNEICPGRPFAYGRYWHGYLMTLRPLLMFFNYSDIRIIGATALLITLFLSFLGIMRRCAKGFAFLYLGVMLAAVCPPVFISLQYTTCFLLTFSFVGILTFFPSLTADKHRVRIYFFVIGMVTVFFDFLTVPVTTLCFPLTIYCLMKRDDSGLRNVFVLVSLWFLGYGGLWMTKWLLATLITGQNFFTDAFNSVAIRTYGEGITLTALKRICIVYCIILFGFTCMVWMCRYKKPILYKYSSFLIISLLPAIWLLVLRGHTLHHFWFTYRAFYASLFALTVYVIKTAHAKNSNSYSLS